MITATYNPTSATVTMQWGIGESQWEQTIPADRYLIRSTNWPAIYPAVVWLKFRD